MHESKNIPFNLKNPQESLMQRNRKVSGSLELLSNQSLPSSIVSSSYRQI